MLEEAKKLWAVVAVEDDGKSKDGESRFIRIGVIYGKFYTCIFTYRNSNIRLISLRRSRAGEIKLYGEQLKNEKEKT